MYNLIKALTSDPPTPLTVEMLIEVHLDLTSVFDGGQGNGGERSVYHIPTMEMLAKRFAAATKKLERDLADDGERLAAEGKVEATEMLARVYPRIEKYIRCKWSESGTWAAWGGGGVAEESGG